MTITELKKIAIKQIEGLYPLDEINSFFYILSEKYIKKTRLEIALHPDIEISKDIESQFKKAFMQLQSFEPIQYIIGETQFYDLLFLVNKNVLIPRPETEELVDWIVSDYKSYTSPLKILDIGSGSGCIAVSLAKNILNAEIVAIDISSEALKIAKNNAKINNVKLHFVEADILQIDKQINVLKIVSNKFDIIVSNPPYVRESEKKAMQSNVLDYEPEIALYVSNEDPLLFYKKIAKFGQKYLQKKGSLFFEINEFLHVDTMQMLEEFGYVNIELKKDVFNKYRMIKATYNG